MRRAIHSMQPMNDDAGRSEARNLRLQGAGALALLFFASALLTQSYLSGSAGTADPDAQIAAAAAAAPDPFAGIHLLAESAYVRDLSTGRVLYQRDPDRRLPLASITKVMLVLAASEVLPPSAILAITRDTAPLGAAQRLGAGERWKVKDVMTFTLVSSSNEGADILAEAADEALRKRYPEAATVSGPGGATIWRMNDIARGLGLTNTNFLNASGLDLSGSEAGAYGSARDVAALFAHAASSAPALFEGTAKSDVALVAASGERTSALNTDKALGELPGLILGKTGYTDLAGGNLAIVFDAGLAHPVVAVVLHSTQEGRFSDMAQLVAAAQEAIAQGK